MEQLKKAYEAIEMLRALELPVSDEQMKGVARLEKEYLRDEIIPLLKQEMEPMINKIRGNFQIEATYEKGSGLEMSVVIPTERKKDNQSVQESRNITKYSIDGGEPLNKRRFVLAVIKKYVENHPEVTYDQLRAMFPDSLSNSPLHGVFRPYEDIKRKLQNQPDLVKRFFLEKEDLITLSEGTKLTVYNQWGQNFASFLEVAKQLHKVESFNNIINWDGGIG